MTLQQLKYVLKVVEYRSISEAAKNIYISQPALSNSVNELEKELGIEIFSRNTKGISLTSDGEEFLSYARQVVEQTELLEQRYIDKKPSRQICSFSTQHYAFAVNAFVNFVRKTKPDEYDFTFRETRTYEIIEDVRNLKSEVGIIYLNEFNKKVIGKLLKESHIKFTPVFTARPHVFVSSKNPLAKRRRVSLSDLESYPFLCFEQGDYNSFYFSEEILSTIPRKKIIHVSDRGTLFNLLIGLNGYTICSGIVTSDLNGTQVVSIPLEVHGNEDMTVGYITSERTPVSRYGRQFIEELVNFRIDSREFRK
ncbi:MAG: LysR family transcriptional regulator [Treponema sp.]|uniref:LysR family transcriptional regulator n=1 Tax=Treponema sp. TaxID=166 RepID=UPI00298E4361|nr:LysR family transcriptional regulator [Treponema sp.]MBR5932759.1 LysR family transcriptional regulator [Treponema sp.]